MTAVRAAQLRFPLDDGTETDALVDAVERERDAVCAQFQRAREAGAILAAAVRGFLAAPSEASRAGLVEASAVWVERGSNNFWSPPAEGFTEGTADA